MKQKTFHSLTGSFITSVIGTLPNISTEKMQYWIERPNLLASALVKILKSEFIVIEEDDTTYKGRLAMRITKVGDELFHRQTAKFIAVIAQNIPELPNEKMEFWNSHLNTLQKSLEALK